MQPGERRPHHPQPQLLQFRVGEERRGPVAGGLHYSVDQSRTPHSVDQGRWENRTPMKRQNPRSIETAAHKPGFETSAA